MPSRRPLLFPLLVLLLSAPACAQRPAERVPEAAAPPPTTANADSVLARAGRSRVRGTESAPLTIVEVSDFQCPFCRQFATGTHAALDSAYLRPGKARLLFISYPLPNHPQSWAASEAALCAGAQDAFWPMHDRLFATQPEWSGKADAGAHFLRLAAELRLDTGAFRTCVENDQVATIIISDILQASGAGVNGTPTFALQRAGAQPDQRVLVGAQSFEEMSRQLDAMLAAPAAQQ